MTEKPFYINEEEEFIDIKTEILKYLRFWPWFLSAVIVFLILAFIYLKITPVTYKTTAKVKILDKSSKGMKLPTDLTSLIGNSKVNLENEIEVLKSYRLLEAVVKEQDLNVQCYDTESIQDVALWPLPFEINFRELLNRDAKNEVYLVNFTKKGYVVENEISGEIWVVKDSVNSINGDVSPFTIRIANELDASLYTGRQFKIERSSIYRSVMELTKILTINSVGKRSEILNLGVVGANYKRSEVIVNSIVDKFNEDGVKDRKLKSQRTLDFINDRFTSLIKELDVIEDGKKDYKKANALSYIEGDAKYTIEKKAESEKEQLRIETQRALANLLQETLKKEKAFSLLPANIGLENSNINKQINDYNTLVLEREKILKSAGENNPAVQIVSSQLKNVQVNILLSVKVYKKQLDLTLRKVSNIKRESSRLFSSIPEKEKTLRSIERQQTIKESLYILLLQKREESAINLAITTPSVKVIDYAMTSLIPVGPKKKIIYLGALLLGVLLPFGVLYLRFLLDTKIHGKNDIETLVPESIVAGEIPEIKSEQLLVTMNDRSILAEAFRMVTTNIKYLLPVTESKQAKVIYVTSSIKGEGKTFNSLNIALTYASMKKKVLLVGADLRNPQLHSYVNITKDSAGLSNYLFQPGTEWKKNVINKMFGKLPLDVLFSGVIPPNSAELLSNGRFSMLLEEAKEVYDYIIVDTAPTMLVTDTLLISEHADVTIYVTRANYTEKKILEFSKKLKKEGKLKHVTYVVNNVDLTGSNGYNYGYGYGYDEDIEKKPWLKRVFFRG